MSPVFFWEMNAAARTRRVLLSRRTVWILVILSFAWRLDGLDRESLWRDEIDAIYFALGDLESLLSMFVGIGQNGPLYFTFLRPWLWGVGSSEFALRYPSLLMGVLCVPLMWQVGRRLLSSPAFADSQNLETHQKNNRESYWHIILSEPGLLAAAFLAVSPYQLWYSQEGKMYTATTLLALVATWFWLNGCVGQKDRISWLGLLIVVALGLYTHLLLALLLPLLGVWFLVAYGRYRSHTLGLLLALLAVIAIYAHQAPWIWQYLQSPDQYGGRPFIPLPEVLQETLNYQLNGVLPPLGGGMWLLPQLILAAAGMLYGYRTLPAGGKGWDHALPAWGRHAMVVSWLILPTLAIYTLSLRLPVFAPRYIIWIAPALMMVLAQGIQLLGPHRSVWQRWIATILVVYVLGHGIIAGWQQKNMTIKFDLRSAVDYIVQRRRPEELLILHIPHLEYAYRYYSGDQGAQPFEDSDARLGWWAGGLFTNNELAEPEAIEQVAEEMQALTGGAEVIWVIRSEVEMWDARDLMDKWLRQHYLLIEQVTFNGTQVIHYRLTP